MATVTTNAFKPGLKLLIDGEPCNIVTTEFVKPGKGQAFSRVRMRNLRDGRMRDRTFRSGEQVTLAEVVELELQYLYNEAGHWFFMDNKSYEQYTADATVVGDAAKWLVEQFSSQATLWNGGIISVNLPAAVTLAVSSTAPGVRGDTVSGGSKEAVLQTGTTVRVPLFVEPGERIRISTRTGEYLGREKE